MGEIRTGNNPLYYAGNGAQIAQNQAVLGLFGAILGLRLPGGLLAISHFRGACKSFIMRGLQFASYKRHYVNYLCRIE